MTHPVTIHRIHVDDVDFHLEVQGEGPPLVLLNGGFGSTVLMRDVIDGLSEHFTVYAHDPRGHGQSSLGVGPVTYVREAVDATRLMDHLGLKTAHFWGHSDGGCVLLHLLFDYPHRVRSATLSGTPHDRSAYPPAAAKLCAELPKTLARGETDAYGMRARLLVEGMEAQKIRQLAAALDRAWSATPNVTVEMMRCIDRPVLVVEAGADPFIPLDAFERITQAIPGARAIRLPAMDHDPRPTIATVAAAAAAMAAEVDAAAGFSPTC